MTNRGVRSGSANVYGSATSVQELGEAARVRTLEVDERDAERALVGQRVAADLADHPGRGPEGAQRGGVARDQEGARALAEQLLRGQAGDRGAEVRGER